MYMMFRQSLSHTQISATSFSSIVVERKVSVVFYSEAQSLQKAQNVIHKLSQTKKKQKIVKTESTNIWRKIQTIDKFCQSFPNRRWFKHNPDKFSKIISSSVSLGVDAGKPWSSFTVTDSQHPTTLDVMGEGIKILKNCWSSCIRKFWLISYAKW